MIRIGIMGYGNLGRGIECAIKQNDDLELAAVFTRRDPATVSILTEGAAVCNVKDIEEWKDKIDVIEKNNDKLNEQKDKYDSILSAIQKVYDDEIKKANKKKDSIQDIIDAMSDENDEYERQKKLQEAIYNLNKANSQKTKYLLKDGQFVYSTDNSAIRDAQDSLHDAKYDVDVANLKKQQDDIDNYIDTLNEFKDKWNEISDAFSEAQDAMNLKQYLGSEYQRIILSNNLADIENIRVSYLGKKGSVTDLLKGMKELSNDERKVFGQKVNELKGLVNQKITEKTQELKEKEIQKEIELMPEFDLSMPPVMDRGSYHPITLVQRECERIFKSMGFTVEDYSEIVTDYECFESLNIPKHHPARDMQDTYYLTNGQLLKSQTSAAQNAIYKKYRDALVNDGVPIKAIFPGRCFRNEATDACHENTFFQMEGVMVDKNISISNLIYFMKTMLSEVFQKDIKVRLRPGFFPFVEPGFELDISCLICGGEGCPSCKHSGWLELCPCGMIHPEVLKAGGIDPDEYTGFAFGLGLTRLVMMKYGIKDIRDLNSGSLKTLSQFTDDEN